MQEEQKSKLKVFENSFIKSKNKLNENVIKNEELEKELSIKNKLCNEQNKEIFDLNNKLTINNNELKEY